MRTCFVPFCDLKNKDQPKRTMFLPPKERKLFALWAEALPKSRELKPTDKVCYLHFRPDQVLNTFNHCINGQLIKIKRDRPRLMPNAIPCLDMTTEKDGLSHRAKSRVSYQSKIANTKQISELNINEPEEVNDAVNFYIEVTTEEEQNEISSNIVHMENKVSDCESDEEQTTEDFKFKIKEILAAETNYDRHVKLIATSDVEKDDLAATELTNLFNLLYENVNEVLMPNTLWGIHLCPQGSLICFSYMDVYTMFVTKMVIIKNDGSVQLLIEGNVIKTLQLLRDIDGLDGLSILLHKMDVGRLCFGQSTNANCDLIVEPNNENCWFKDDNEQVYLCKFCLPKN